MLIIGSFVLWFFNKFKVYSDKKNHEIDELKFNVSNIKSDIKKLNDEILKNKNTFQTFQNEAENIKKELKDLKTRDVNKNLHLTETYTPPQPPPPLIRYASVPSELDGGFISSSLKPDKDIRSIYKITFQNEELAYYSVIEDRNTFRLALDNSNYLLKPACDYDNSPSEGDNIKTLREGRLRKTGSLWRIQEKALIRFY